MKQELMDFCWGYVNQRIERLAKNSAELQESLILEDKNSTGDKHETGRAMLHLEQEKLSGQLLEAEQTRTALKKVDIHGPLGEVRMGSLVRTGMARYFLSISAGTFTKGTETIYCISGASPMAQLLLGRTAGDSFTFHGTTHDILEVS